MTTLMTSPTLEFNEHASLKPLAAPHTSVVEAAGWLIIDMEMPGVVARDLDVEIDGTWVTIKSLPRVDAPASPDRIARDHMKTPLERVIELPGSIDLERSKAIRATLLDGVLRLVLPIKRPQASGTTALDS